MVNKEAIELTLYYRENCHLCESMRLAMMKLQKKIDFNWIEVDIDRDIDLIREYDIRIPVLTFKEQEICHHFIDEPAIRRLVTR